ncbi:MAG: hypothetical protein ACRDMH_01050 [Solirubrobacterales bacterium]
MTEPDDFGLRSPQRASRVVLATFRLYSRYPILFLVLALGVVVPYDVIVLAATGTGPSAREGLSVELSLTLFLLSSVLIGPLISALHVHAVDDVRKERDPRVLSVARRGLRVLPVVVAAAIVSGFGITAGLVLLIVPGIILLLRWYVVAQAAAIEHEGWLPALRRSAELTARHYGHIFVFFVVVTAVLVGPTLVEHAFVSGRDASAVEFVLSVAIHAFTASFGALTTALLYFDLINRRDAR